MKPRSATMPYCRAPPARASAVCVRVGRDRERAVPDATLVRLSLAEAADLIQRRALSPVELLEAVLARIAVADARLNAFTTLVPVEEARAAARAAEREIAAGTYRGPPHGIPAGVKDLLDTAGLRTTYGSGMFRHPVPSVDGAVPERLRAAGAAAAHGPRPGARAPGDTWMRTRLRGPAAGTGPRPPPAPRGGRPTPPHRPAPRRAPPATRRRSRRGICGDARPARGTRGACR